jgi:hypothetical protein
MKHAMLSRRYLTFSLRTLFIILMALAVWLDVAVNWAREQREAVKAIETLGGSVGYDWQDVPLAPDDVFSLDGPLTPPGPAWLRRLVGDEFFQDAVEVDFWKEIDPLKAIAHLKRLRKLETVIVPFKTPTATMDELRAALPNCEIKIIVL